MPIQKAKEGLQMILQTMLTLMSSAFGLVVALAWNEAIKKAMEDSIGKGEDTTALFTYAVTATLIAVIFVLLLAWVASKVGGKAAIEREADL